MHAKYEVYMGKFLQWKPTFNRKGTLYFKYSIRHSWPIAAHFTICRACVGSAACEYSRKSLL